MDVSEAILNRRSVRKYTNRMVDRATIETLLEAAVLAPSAINLQPWAFVVIQDQSLLKKYSDRAKDLVASTYDSKSMPPKFKTMLADQEYNIFYNASSLILICAKPLGQHPDWDCCLAAENLMLAAKAAGLGTCPIGLAWPLFQQSDVRQELNIAPELQPVLPIIVGYPDETPARVPRNQAEILYWK